MINMRIVLENGEDGFIVASCPALKGCWSQGKSEEEALNNIKEAIHLYLESPPKDTRRSKKRKILKLAI